MAAGKENKTKPEATSVAAFLAAVEDPNKRADSQVLLETMARLTGEEPVMWGDSMIGFGTYHYRYDSGHEGDSFLVGFSPRKAEFSIYVMGCFMPESAEQSRDLLDKLGKHRMGKACLYVKRLSDIDMGVLEQLILRSAASLRQHYG